MRRKSDSACALSATKPAATDIENYKAPASSSPGAATIGELLSWKREQQD